MKNNTLSRAELSDEEGAAFDVHYGDVLIKYGSVLDLKNDHLPRIADASVVEKLTCDSLRDGDVVIADTAEDFTTGKCTELRNIGSDKVFAGLHTMPCRPVNQYATGFLGHYLNTASFHEQLIPLLQGTKVIALSKAAMSETNLMVPSFAEQQAIGRFFSRLDSLITLHQRKYDKLVVLKKAMLEQMFPQEGESVPKIRFAGFTDPWEQRKLGEIADSFSGGTPDVGNSTYYGGTIPFIRSAEINSDSTELYLTQQGLNDSAARLVEQGTVLYALYGATSGEVGVARLSGAINQAVLAVLPNAGNDSSFIANWLRKEKTRIVGTYLQGGQGNLSGAIVKKLSLSLPTPAEQQAIGSFFSRLDSLITLHQRKLELLQNIKKSLLEQMFV